MATLYGTNATKRANQTIPDLEVQGEKNAPIKVAYDNYVQSVATSQNDTIRLMKLPPGSRVMNVYVAWSGSLDASGGTLSLGWEANSVDAASAAGFLSAVDITTAGGAQDMQGDQGTVAGIGKKFDVAGGETQVTALCAASGGWDSTAGNTLHVWVLYTID